MYRQAIEYHRPLMMMRTARLMQWQHAESRTRGVSGVEMKMKERRGQLDAVLEATTRWEPHGGLLPCVPW